MGASLTIFQKGLLLLAVPLLFQLAFFGALYKVELDGEETQRWAVHTKEVMAQTEAAYRYLLESTAYVRRLVITREDPAASPPAHDTLREAPAQFQKLMDLVVDNPQQRAMVAETAAEAERLRGQLVEALGLIAAGRRDQAAARMRDPAVQDILDSVRRRLDEFLAGEGRLDAERTAALYASWRRENWLIGAGAALAVMVALLIALLFTRNITGRLARLTENVNRLRDKKELTQPLSGVDEIARLDAAFRTMARALREREQENEMFIYSVSHDLRSPLVNLQGFSEELRLSCDDLRAALEPAGGTAVAVPARKILDTDIPDSLHFIRTAVSRLSAIIDALLRLSRVGRVEYCIQPVNVEETTRRVVETLGGAVKAKKAEVVIGPMPPALGDPTAVEQIFANLIGNAVNYLDPSRPGKVEIGAATAGEKAAPPGLQTYYVRDNGLGIPAEYQDRVFLAFKRLHVNAAPGEGVGLALVYRMVGRLGGKIWLESAAGAGSTFYVALPAAPAARARPGRRGGKDHPTMTAEVHPVTIVLAEDDDGHATLIQRNLERAGLANGFLRLKDGQEALDYFRSQGGYAGRPPDPSVLLLLDINMPRVDGVEVLRALKADKRTALVPIIMLTTTDDPREVQRCYQLGCSVYVTKPVEYQPFIDAIKRLGLFLQVVQVPRNGGKD